MKKLVRAYSYLKKYGINAFNERTIQYFKLQKTKEYRLTNEGIYKVKNKYIKSVKTKTKEIYLISSDFLTLENKNIELISKLNLLGYKIHYYYINKSTQKINYALPVVENKYIKNIDLSILKNKKVFIDDNININIKNAEILKKKDINNLFEKNNYNYKNFYNSISVIILNYNNKDIISKCIDSLIKYNDYKYEIIVVDNNSTDGSYELLKQKYDKKIKLLKNDLNGCSSGRNLGIKNSNNDYVLFLDSDQYPIYHNWLDNYLEIIDKGNVAISWAAGWFKKNGYSGQITDNYLFRYMSPEYLYRNDIGYLGSGGLLVKKKTLEKIGMFDINYDPTSYEDTDISLNLRNNKIELIYCPYLGIIHDSHQTTKSGSKQYDILMEKNAKYFKNKWLKINKNLLKYIK